MSIKVMKQALEALEYGEKAHLFVNTEGVMFNLRAAIAEAKTKAKDYEIHKAHCFQPPYETSCKYGDDDCPMS